MHPLVSAVMVTGKDARRYRLAQASLRSFCAQKWPQRELVIINDGLQWVLPGHADGEPMYREMQHIDAAAENASCVIREFRLPPNQGFKLGELRNFALAKVKGDWICQWDDDDWFHPDRISTQMEFRKPDHAVLFLEQIRCSLVWRSAFAYRHKKKEGIHGSILHPRTTAQYEPIGKHEDSHFLNTAFGNRRILIDNDGCPELHVRLHHECNTWNDAHIMGPYATSRVGVFDLPSNKSAWLKDLLVREYGYAP